MEVKWENTGEQDTKSGEFQYYTGADCNRNSDSAAEWSNCEISGKDRRYD